MNEIEKRMIANLREASTPHTIGRSSVAKSNENDPSHAIEAGKKYGIKMLSPEEARQALPHFGGLGANLT